MAAATEADSRPGATKGICRPTRDGTLRGPIPIAWLQKASRLPGKSLHAGLALWIAAARMKTPIVHLSNVDGMRLGCSRNQKYRALDWLESAGLVSVQRRTGCSPIVTLIRQPPSLRAADEAVQRSGTAKSAALRGEIQSTSGFRRSGGAK